MGVRRGRKGRALGGGKEREKWWKFLTLFGINLFKKGM
jgi:hypothetical protein